jgi:hypothetical protein
MEQELKELNEIQTKKLNYLHDEVKKLQDTVATMVVLIGVSAYTIIAYKIISKL